MSAVSITRMTDDSQARLATGSGGYVRDPSAGCVDAAGGTDAPAGFEGPSMPNVAVNLTGVRVLIVDDDEEALALTQRILEDSHADVTTALRGYRTSCSRTSACPKKTGIH